MAFKYTKEELEQIAKESNFTLANIEKVMRLAVVLRDINTMEGLKGKLLLKGGTAINLIIFSMPRLSIDLDLNYSKNISKDDMLKERAGINAVLNAYIEKEGYTKTERNTYALDSISLHYKTLSGGNDKIKLDINYYTRSQIYKPVTTEVDFPFAGDTFKVDHLDPIELYAGKIGAFYERSKPRDVFDIDMLANSDLFKSQEKKDALRKSVVYHLSLANDRNLINKDIRGIKDSPFLAYKQQLLPLMTKGIRLEKDKMSESVVNYISGLMVLNDREKKYLSEFNRGNYQPSLLFDGEEIIDRLEKNPVAQRMQEQILKEVSEISIVEIKGKNYISAMLNGEQQLNTSILPEDLEAYKNGQLSTTALLKKYYCEYFSKK